MGRAVRPREIRAAAEKKQIPLFPVAPGRRKRDDPRAIEPSSSHFLVRPAVVPVQCRPTLELFSILIAFSFDNRQKRPPTSTPLFFPPPNKRLVVSCQSQRPVVVVVILVQTPHLDPSFQCGLIDWNKTLRHLNS
ncbi:hypothetical protein VTJ04DRAFT_10049 [Mycothermus thermophilus]|uniref:uncharacterized protein n=1 Tax=Humicola insolens TaxID=85995 RepID=UPI0037430E30